MRTSLWPTAAMILLLSTGASFSLAEVAPPSGADMQYQYRGSFLHIDGSRLAKATGQEVDLHGINIGGWLVTETWMCGFSDSKDSPEISGNGGVSGRSTLASLEDRFGSDQAASLIKVWQDHWITNSDLDQIRDGGFNLIRVPISYRTLQHADGTWILDAHSQIDFTRMDWIVREAAQRGIYTVFDLHVWPEQRLASDKIGRPEGEAIRDSMSRLWTAIATHYRGNGAIAAFDLINELPGAWGVQQVLSRAVTTGDPDRIQVIEGFTFPEFLKLHTAGEFPNSIFSDHLYGAGPLSTEEIRSRLKETLGSPVPVYIGEFLAADFASATQAMNEAKVSWSPWTYKAVDMGQWAIFNYDPTLKVDIQNDTFQAIDEKWSAALISWQIPDSPQHYFINTGRLYGAPSSTSVPFAN